MSDEEAAGGVRARVGSCITTPIGPATIASGRGSIGASRPILPHLGIPTIPSASTSRPWGPRRRGCRRGSRSRPGSCNSSSRSVDAGDLTPIARPTQGTDLLLDGRLRRREGPAGPGTDRGGPAARGATPCRGGTAMMIGGNDLIFFAPEDVPVVGLDPATCPRALAPRPFPGCRTKGPSATSTTPGSSTGASESREFLIYRDQDAVEAWDRDGAEPENLDTMFYFLDRIGRRRSKPGRRELTLGLRRADRDHRTARSRPGSRIRGGPRRVGMDRPRSV